MVQWLSRARAQIRIFLAAAFVLYACPARTEEIPLDRFIVQFAPNELAGIAVILRFAIAAPDRNDVGIMFLEESGNAKDPPENIQFFNENGSTQPKLIESEGADCTLQHVALFRNHAAIAVVIATRVFDATFISQSGPAPMDLKLYQLKHGEGPAQSTLVFAPTGATLRTEPICSRFDLKAPITAIINDWQSTVPKEP